MIRGDITFCDDVRQEISNKFILIGIYSDELIVQQPVPYVLLFVVARLRGLAPNTRIRLKLSVSMKLSQLVVAENEMDFETGVHGRLFIASGQFPISTASDEVIVRVTGENGDVFADDTLVIANQTEGNAVA